MTQQKLRENGEDPRLKLVLTLDGGRRRNMTATITMTALNDEEQARFDTEVENLLGQFVHQQVKFKEG